MTHIETGARYKVNDMDDGIDFGDTWVPNGTTLRITKIILDTEEGVEVHAHLEQPATSVFNESDETEEVSDVSFHENEYTSLTEMISTLSATLIPLD